MTTKNAILLMVKQSPGIEYNALLSKISPNYGSVNSARAALSRAIKDMNAVGLIRRQDNRFFATDKGQIQIHSEMKNKLLIKLNQTIKSKNSFENIDAIVEQLATLIERSKADSDLLRAAKGATDFFIVDLHRIHGQLKKRMRQLNYLQEIFEKQIGVLQQMDFLDSLEMPFNQNTAKQLQQFLEKQDSQEFLLAAIQTSTIQEIAASLNEKIKSGTLVLPKTKIEKVFSVLLQQAKKETLNATLHTGNFKLRLNNQNAFLSGPFSQLQKIKE